MGSRIPHASSEEQDVLPPSCDCMDDDDPGSLAALEHTTSHRLGSVEPGDGAGPLLGVAGGLDGAARHGQACLAPGVVAPAAPGAPGRPTLLDGPGAGGSGLGRPLAVAAHHAAGVASVFAPQHGWHLAAHGPGAWAPLEDVGARAGHDVAGDGPRLHRPPPAAARYPAGLLGGGLQRSMVDPDRPATRSQHRRLVWLVGLDFARVAE